MTPGSAVRPELLDSSVKNQLSAINRQQVLVVVVVVALRAVPIIDDKSDDDNEYATLG
jgi:hypothetical protein